MLGQYYNAEMFHFKFMDMIPNYGRNLKVTSKTSPSINSSPNFRTPFVVEKIGHKYENYVSKYGVYVRFVLKVHQFPHSSQKMLLIAIDPVLQMAMFDLHITLIYELPCEIAKL
jgi:hypothetical protein